MVAIFFVVSGFSLSVGPLRRIRSNDLNGLLGSLASSVTRRWVRLFMPCAALTFIVMIQIHIGADGGRLVAESGPPKMLLVAQLKNWWADFTKLSNPFNNIDLNSPLNNMSIFAATLWTIPVEFRGSMAVYLVLLACSRMQDRSRTGFICGVTLYCMYFTHWDLAQFLSGVVLAEMHLRREDPKVSNSPSTISRGLAILFKGEDSNAAAARSFSTPVLKAIFWILNFGFATYILCTPFRVRFAMGQGDPGYVFIWSLMPTRYFEVPAWDRFWPMVGAIYTVCTIDNCKLLQAFFTLRFSKYLGWISFSLYLVHLPFINTFAEMILHALWELDKSPNGVFPQTGYWIAFWTGYLLSLLGIFWAADIFTRVFDEPSVRLSKRLYAKLLGQEQKA
jgi:peptidoglycan/LPS O-acetylase OafA/YrhL